MNGTRDSHRWFVGREAELVWAREQFAAAARASGASGLSVVGERGIGKSVFIDALARSLRTTPRRRRVVRFEAARTLALASVHVESALRFAALARAERAFLLVEIDRHETMERERLRAVGLEELELGTLGPSAIAEIVAHAARVARRPISEPERAIAVEFAAGHPGFARERVEFEIPPSAVARARALARTVGATAARDIASLAIATPPGQRPDRSAWIEVNDGSIARFRAIVALAERIGLLEGGRFAHEAIRAACASLVPQASRKRRHRRTARFLESMRPSVERNVAIGFHLAQAGAHQRAADYYVAAANEESIDGHSSVAHRLYRTALALGIENPVRYGRTLVRFAETAESIGSTTVAVGAYERAHAHYRRLGNAVRTRACATALARIRVRRHEPGEVVATISEAKSSLTSTDDVERMELDMVLLASANDAEDPRRARRILGRLLASSIAAPPGIRAEILRQRAIFMATFVDRRLLTTCEIVAAFEDALRVADAAGERLVAMRTCSNLAHALFVAGQAAAADAVAERALAIATAYDNSVYQAFYRFQLVEFAAMRGDLERARVQFEAAGGIEAPELRLFRLLLGARIGCADVRDIEAYRDLFRSARRSDAERFTLSAAALSTSLFRMGFDEEIGALVDELCVRPWRVRTAPELLFFAARFGSDATVAMARSSVSTLAPLYGAAHVAAFAAGVAAVDRRTTVVGRRAARVAAAAGTFAAIGWHGPAELIEELASRYSHATLR